MRIFISFLFIVLFSIFDSNAQDTTSLVVDTVAVEDSTMAEDVAIKCYVKDYDGTVTYYDTLLFSSTSGADRYITNGGKKVFAKKYASMVFAFTGRKTVSRLVHIDTISRYAQDVRYNLKKGDKDENGIRYYKITKYWKGETDEEIGKTNSSGRVIFSDSTGRFLIVFYRFADVTDHLFILDDKAVRFSSNNNSKQKKIAVDMAIDAFAGYDEVTSRLFKIKGLSSKPLSTAKKQYELWNEIEQLYYDKYYVEL